MSNIADDIDSVIRDTEKRSQDLESEARYLRSRHQIYTVSTIILGVIAPAAISYTPPVGYEVYWKLFAIFVTAFATASATIRTVLRYGERYSNSSLTSIALLDLKSQIQAKKEDIAITVKEEFKAQKLYEVSAWGRRQMFEILKGFVEKDVSAITQDKIEIVPPPQIPENQRADPTKKS